MNFSFLEFLLFIVFQQIVFFFGGCTDTPYNSGCSPILEEINYFFENLSNGRIENKQLLEDYQSFGKESFQFYVLDCALEYENDMKRQVSLYFFKNNYSGDVY